MTYREVVKTFVVTFSVFSEKITYKNNFSLNTFYVCTLRVQTGLRPF
jgi:hypothetical protein